MLDSCMRRSRSGVVCLVVVCFLFVFCSACLAVFCFSFLSRRSVSASIPPGFSSVSPATAGPVVSPHLVPHDLLVFVKIFSPFFFFFCFCLVLALNLTFPFLMRKKKKNWQQNLFLPSKKQKTKNNLTLRKLCERMVSFYFPFVFLKPRPLPVCIS